MPDDWMYVWLKDKKKMAQINAKYKAEMISAKGGFDNDIKKVLGVYLSDIYVQINSEDKNHFYIDVISDDAFKYQIKIPIPENSKETRNIDLQGEFLLCHFKDDEIGPYLKTYKISRN